MSTGTCPGFAHAHCILPHALGLSMAGTRAQAVFGFKVILEDLESVDPELYTTRIAYLKTAVYKEQSVTLEDLGLTFIDDSNDEDYSMPTGGVELKPGGAEIEVGVLQISKARIRIWCCGSKVEVCLLVRLLAHA